MSRIDRVRQYLATTSLPPIKTEEARYYDFRAGVSRSRDDLDVDHAILDASFTYFIDLEDAPLGEGRSQRSGIPRLPATWQMPAAWHELRFFMQLDLSELAPLDLEERLPRTGTLWVFQDPGENRCQVLYLADPAIELVERPDVPSFDVEPAGLRFRPGFTFLINHGDAYEYEWIRGALPAELRTELESQLGCEMVEGMGEQRLFGHPVCWQGEDEGAGEDEPHLLWLHQTDGDASLHFWIRAEALRRGDFSAVAQTASTT